MTTKQMKLLRPLAGYTFHDHNTKDYIRMPLTTDYWYNTQDRRIQTDRREGEQWEDRRNVGESSCN